MFGFATQVTVSGQGTVDMDRRRQWPTAGWMVPVGERWQRAHVCVDMPLGELNWTTTTTTAFVYGCETIGLTARISECDVKVLRMM